MTKIKYRHKTAAQELAELQADCHNAKSWIRRAKKRMETLVIDDIEMAQWMLDQALEELDDRQDHRC